MMHLYWKVTLQGGGTVSIDITVGNLGQLTEKDGAFVTEVVDAFREYAIGRVDDDALRRLSDEAASVGSVSR